MGLAWLDRKRARRGWIGLLCTAAGLSVLLGIDFYFFSTHDEAIVLPGRDWTLSSADLPSTWADFDRSAVYQRIAEQAPELRPRVEAWMRRTTGMRWTPLRWNLWFGRVVAVSGLDDAAVFSVRAKFLARSLFDAARLAGLLETREGVSRISGLHVARSGKFFLVGTTPEIVSRLAANGEKRSSAGGRGITFDSSGEPAAAVEATADGEVAVSIWLEQIDHRAPERAGYFAIEWPEKPIISVVTRGLDLNSIVPENDWPEFPGSEELARTWEDFETLLPEGWRAGADTTQFALFDVDTSEGVPVPDAAVYSRSETPLAPLLPPPNAIAYEWSGRAGWMTPWLGEGANLFVAADERSRVFANQEATMAKLMGRERAGRISSNDARIEIDTARLAKVLSDLARQAAKDELWPERNADDVEHDIIPWLNAFGALGEIQFEGKYENGGITLRGGTHAPVAENAS